MHLSRTQIRQSKAIQRHTGTTFHFATRFLPERIRYPTYVLYAFFRIADDIVDDEDPIPPADQRAELERIRAAGLGDEDTEEPVLSAFADLRETHDIPREEVDVFIDAMLMDIDTARYHSHDELSQYLRGSSVAVAQMMLEVMDPPEKEAARPHAAALAEALQLTNFLRDVREDIRDYDRVYLPEARLEANGASHADIEAGRMTDGVRATIRDELERTEEKYEKGVEGIRYLPRKTRFAVLASAVMYADYHRLIRKQDYDVLTDPPRLSVTRRISLLARTWITWKRTGDPKRAFHAVTDLPMIDIDSRLGWPTLRDTVGSLGSLVARAGKGLIGRSIGRVL